MFAYKFVKTNPLACADAFVALMLVVLVSLPAWAVDNTNLPGSDYANFAAPSASVCRNTCGGEDGVR